MYRISGLLWALARPFVKKCLCTSSLLLRLNNFHCWSNNEKLCWCHLRVAFGQEDCRGELYNLSSTQKTKQNSVCCRDKQIQGEKYLQRSCNIGRNSRFAIYEQQKIQKPSVIQVEGDGWSHQPWAHPSLSQPLYTWSTESRPGGPQHKKDAKLEAVGSVQLGEERASGKPHCDLPVLKGNLHTSRFLHHLILVGRGGVASNKRW